MISELHVFQQELIVPLQSADEVACVVHGTYYASWSKILQQGLVTSSSRNLIPCYPYVPRNTGAPHAYQLYIFIDVHKAMMDGIKFFKAGDRQILCSGDRRGCLHPRYFNNVLDSETGSIIYPLQTGTGLNGPPQNNMQGVRGCGITLTGPLQNNMAGGRSRGPALTGPPQNNMQGMRGHGRGAPISSIQPPQTMHLYENIWSQMQRLDPEHVDLRPYQTQKPFTCVQQPQQPVQPNSNSGRVEVSVEDIFRGAAKHPQPQPQQQQQLHQPNHHNKQQQPQGEPNILSLLSAAHQSYALNSPPAPALHKNGSPSKSAFVPTQVIRKQTPRKPRSNGNDSTQAEKAEPSTSTHSLPKQQQQQQKKEQNNHHQQKQQQHQQQKQQHQGAEGTTKPKRQVRNRLAVRFDQAPGNKD